MTLFIAMVNLTQRLIFYQEYPIRRRIRQTMKGTFLKSSKMAAQKAWGHPPVTRKPQKIYKRR